MSIKVRIEGMSCNHCIMAIRKKLSELQLENFEVMIGFAAIEFNENKIDSRQIIKAIQEAGYLAHEI